MYLLLIIVGIPLILLGISYWFHKAEISMDGANYTNAKIVYKVATIATLLIVLVVNLVTISDQKADILEVKMLQNQKEILSQRADTLVAELQEVLIQNYPEYEKEIFGNMSPEDLKMLFVKYPDVKNALVSMNYTEKLQNFIDDIYRKDLEIEKVMKDINYRYVNPWIFNSWMPTIDGVNLELVETLK